MNVIKKLSPHVADLIAAGEVVERPASVVKELLENSFDASATQITIEIQRGGMGLIRVTDNGCGMSPEDAGTAFLRHATSKLRDAEGLEAIGTLGFRGEALAAIASVSRVQLLTREKGSSEGIALSLEAGKEVSRAPAGCPEGTTIIVRDLFYNTPARLKFMKKDSYEGSAVSTAVIRCALSHPSVSVRYLKDGAEEFKTAGSGKTDACIYTLLGRDFAKNMLHAAGSSDGISIDGYVSSPSATHGNRNMQYFFVNGRHIKSILIQTALEKAYQNRLFTGRFPGCVLFLSVRQNAVDVNVHPAKTEVRFLQERQVFDAVFRSVCSALDNETAMPEFAATKPQKEVPHRSETAAPEAGKREEGFASSPARFSAVSGSGRDFSAESAKPPTERKNPDPNASEYSRKPSGREMRRVVQQLVFNQTPDYSCQVGIPGIPAPEESPDRKISAVSGNNEVRRSESEGVGQSGEAQQSLCAEKSESPAAAGHEGSVSDYRIIGELFREYILVEQGQSMLLIDKHAVHERILFDQMVSTKGDPLIQTFLEPEIVELSPQDRAVLLSNQKLLGELGLELKEAGMNCVSVLTLPDCCPRAELPSFLCEIAEAIAVGAAPETLGIRDEVIASMACKAAVKAGMNQDPSELVPLVEAVLSQKVKYCPHGRPVSVSLTRTQLDKSFKRI